MAAVAAEAADAAVAAEAAVVAEAAEAADITCSYNSRQARTGFKKIGRYHFNTPRTEPLTN